MTLLACKHLWKGLLLEYWWGQLQGRGSDARGRREPRQTLPVSLLCQA